MWIPKFTWISVLKVYFYYFAYVHVCRSVWVNAMSVQVFVDVERGSQICCSCSYQRVLGAKLRLFGIRFFERAADTLNHRVVSSVSDYCMSSENLVIGREKHLSEGNNLKNFLWPSRNVIRCAICPVVAKNTPIDILPSETTTAGRLRSSEIGYMDDLRSIRSSSSQ